VSEDSDKNTYLFDRIGGQIAYRNPESGFKVPLPEDLVEQGYPRCNERGLIIHDQ